MTPEDDFIDLVKYIMNVRPSFDIHDACHAAAQIMDAAGHFFAPAKKASGEVA